jgi:hypothetical protein
VARVYGIMSNLTDVLGSKMRLRRAYIGVPQTGQRNLRRVWRIIPNSQACRVPVGRAGTLDLGL